MALRAAQKQRSASWCRPRRGSLGAAVSLELGVHERKGREPGHYNLPLYQDPQHKCAAPTRARLGPDTAPRPMAVDNMPPRGERSGHILTSY
jgi:hypothetical protein